MSEKKSLTPGGKVMAGVPVDPQRLFRLPWTMSDNAMSWLEPTRQCDISCDACFHDNDPVSRKSLEQIDHELGTMLRLRRCDAMLIGGGEPLTHPRILEITQLVKSYRVKPVLVTNGVRLTQGLIHDLKKAGLHGVTFHVDAHQDRPGWKGKTEQELNVLRQEFAEMVKQEGDMSCAFNITVFPDTVKDIGDIVEWATRNIDKVHIVTLIPVRMVSPGDSRQYFVGGQRIDMKDTPYVSGMHYENLSSTDIYQEILRALPDYRFCAYLGGTALPASLKWVLGTHVGTAKRSFGNLGARTMELLQYGSHVLRGKYLSYAKPSVNRAARAVFLFALFDPELRKGLRRCVGAVLRDPRVLLEPVYLQSISVVQPADTLPTGERDDCDGCPNKTYWNGRLVSACHFEEYRIYGAPISVAPTEET